MSSQKLRANEKQFEVVRRMRRAHKDIYQRLQSLDEDIKACSNKEEQANNALACHEVVQLAEDIRKMSQRLKDIASQIACAIWTRETANDVGDSEPIRTHHVTATPKVRIIASAPKRGTHEFVSLMGHLGVPEELVEKGVMSFHWPSLMDHISELAEKGKALPPGIDHEKTYPKYSLILTKRDDICGSDEVQESEF